MLGDLMKYGGAFSKVKAMGARLMTRDDYRTMANLGSIDAAAQYLSERAAYHNAFATERKEWSRGEIERELKISLYADYSKLYRFISGVQRKFLERFFVKFESAVLKTLIKNVMDQGRISLDLSEFERFFERHAQFDLKRLEGVKTLAEFAEALEGSPYEQVLAILKTPDVTLFDIEMRLDLKYFTSTWQSMHKHLTRKDLRAVEKNIGTEMDLLNLIWLYRTKRFYDVSGDIAYAYIIPIPYKLSMETLRALATAPSLASFFEIVNQTRYRGFLTADMSTTELIRKYWSTVAQMNRKAARFASFSLAPILEYMDAKDIEMKNIGTIVECIHYGISADDAMARLIDLDERGEANGDR